MRVIAGKFRGRSLAAPAGSTTRPITDQVKETLFNILGNRFGLPGMLPPVAVLDVFAGTGGLGLEALSRGARHCTFIERDRRALGALRDNIRALDVAMCSRVVTDNVWSMRPPLTDDGYGLAFLDPPYRDVDPPTRVLDLLERLRPAFAPDGLVVFRFESRTDFPADRLRAFSVADRRQYRRMVLLFLEPVTA